MVTEDEFNTIHERMAEAGISCGEFDDGKPSHKTIDWEQDQSMIVSDLNKVAGCDIRALPFCHWWTFVAWFNGIGEEQALLDKFLGK